MSVLNQMEYICLTDVLVHDMLAFAQNTTECRKLLFAKLVETIPEVPVLIRVCQLLLLAFFNGCQLDSGRRRRQSKTMRSL